MWQHLGPMPLWNFTQIRTGNCVQQTLLSNRWDRISMICKPGVGRPKTAQTASNIDEVSEMLRSQVQPGMSRNTQQIVSELRISKRSVWWITKVDLNLVAFQRIPAQVLSASVKQKWQDRCKKMIRQIKTVFLTDEKNSTWILLLTIKTIMSGRVKESLTMQQKDS